MKTNLTVIKDSYTTDGQALFSAYVGDKYRLSFEDLKINYSDMEKVIKEIMKTDEDFVRTDFAITLFYDYIVLESPNRLITFDSYDNKKKVQICFFFNNYNNSKKIFDIIQSFQDKEDELFVGVNSFFFDASKNIKTIENLKIKKNFENNSEQYYPFLDTKELFRQFVLNDSNILVLCGKPGVGKSKLADMFMGYLLGTWESELQSKNNLEISSEYRAADGIKVAYVKNEEILSDDIFWNILKEEEYNLVFLDDLDYSLLPRTQQVDSGIDLQKNKFISNLLSFTDGIFNETSVKTKFIITSNRPVKDIDTAVLRKGRTFDILELRDLKRKEAKEIWLSKNLDINTFNKEFKDDNILQADLGTSISMKLKLKKENIELNPYIKEDNISLYSNIKKPKKLGL